jgi:hypothetical protein
MKKARLSIAYTIISLKIEKRRQEIIQNYNLIITANARSLYEQL